MNGEALTPNRMKPTVNCLTTHDAYRTPDRAGSWIGRSSPNTVFYAKAFLIVLHAARLAQKGLYDDGRWVESSITTVRALDSVGATSIFRTWIFRKSSTPRASSSATT